MSSSLFLEEEASKQIASQLAIFLSDTYLVYVKTQNFHWNVRDPRFFSLHEFFEEQYQSLASAIDEIAERIRMLDAKTPGSLNSFLELTRLDDAKDDLTADMMLKMLLQDHQSIIQWIRPEIEQTSKLGDQGTADLLVQRLRAHEKAAWMLKSHFKNN
ncbi:MAG: Dps family protein [Parachlamydiaceae bacterium]